MTDALDMPHVRGRLTENAPLAPLVWFKTGGPTDQLFEPSVDDTLVVLDLQQPARWVAEYYPVESVQELAEGGLRVRLYAADPRWVSRLALRPKKLPSTSSSVPKTRPQASPGAQTASPLTQFCAAPALRCGQI